ncbi:MAG: integral rane protein [Bacteroidota bacterium]
MSKKLLLVGIVLVMIIWGISWPSSKVMTHYASPLQLSAIRFVFNTITVFFILLIAKVPMTITKQGIKPMFLAALLLVGYNIFFFAGITAGLPGKGGILVTTVTPIVTYLLAVLLSKKRMIALEYAGLALGLVAGLLQLKVWDTSLDWLKSGNLFLLACCVTWAFLSRITSKSAQYGSSLGFTLYMYLTCTILLAIVADVPTCFTIVKNADGLFWGNLLFNTVLNAGSATVFYFYATTILGAERTSSFTFIVPFSAAISSYMALGESLKLHTIIGGCVGLVAVYLINYGSIKARMSKSAAAVPQVEA